ncbi:anthranilate synthase component I, partial [bacterium]
MTKPTTTGTSTVVPLRVRVPADLETPVSVFLKLKPLGATFLFESVERGIQAGRYSFIGMAPRSTVVLRDGAVTTTRPDNGGARTRPLDPTDPFAAVRDELALQPRCEDPDKSLPAAFGGAVGYVGYDMVRYFEQVPLPEQAGDADLPDFQFMFPRTLAVFDHVRNEIEFVTTAAPD